MSYGEDPVTLDFEGMHVVCLSGDNGNGKSALLDAITWALWGKTRASGVGSVQEDSLIRVGATEMEVRFEFQLNHDLYRVVRKRKKGKSDWQLAQRNEAGDFVSLSGGSQKETGAQITKLLRMQHETFLNSAYLQQGHADEFTRQRPNDRKRILAEILDLNRYDRLETMAKEKAADYKAQIDELTAEVNQLLRETGRKEEYEQGLTEATEARTRLEAEVQAQDAARQKAQTALEKLKAAQIAVENVSAEIARIERDLQGRQGEQNTKALARKEMEAMQAQRQSIVRDYEDLQQARNRREELDPKVQEFDQVVKEITVAVAAIELEKTRLEGELKHTRQALEHAEKREREKTDLTAKIAALKTELETGKNLSGDVGTLKEKLETVTVEFADRKQKRESVLAQIEEQKETLLELEEAGAKCRLCGGDLSGERRLRVIARQQEGLKTLEETRDALTQEGRELKTEKDTLRVRLEGVETALNRLNTLKAQRETFQQRLNTLCEETEDIEESRKEAALRAKRLENEDFSQAERIRLKTLKNRRETLSLVKAEHQVTLDTIGRLSGAEKRHHNLQSVDSRYGSLLEEMAQLDRIVLEKAAEKAAARKRLEELNRVTADYPRAAAASAAAEQHWRDGMEEWNVRKRDVERFTENLARLEGAKAEASGKQAKVKQFIEAKQCCDALRQAFGKRGIQTQIIENAAIPELEEEANRLLARLSDNNMYVDLQTTRSNASGNADIETLDIIITDDAGTRPYELFSGGEGFRVNFALRIALSRLLARRSGARLQTLILDEGFGSQDGKGREKLVEVIEAIKEDFDLILVITHFDELKDSFPQRVEVIKDARGSRIQLL